MGNPRKRRLKVENNKRKQVGELEQQKKDLFYKIVEQKKNSDVLEPSEPAEEVQGAPESVVERDYKAFVNGLSVTKLKKIATNFEVPRDSMKPKAKLAKWLLANMTDEVYDKYNPQNSPKGS